MLKSWSRAAVLVAMAAVLAASCGNSAEDDVVPMSQLGLAPEARVDTDVVVFDSDSSGSELVVLDGSASFDPDGSIESWEWTSGLEQLAIGPSVELDFPIGTHVLSLTVQDDVGLTDSRTVMVRVRSSDDEAQIEAGAPEIEVWAGEAFSAGAAGNPQRVVNVLGNVADDDGIVALSYRLNGTSPKAVSIGADGRRLPRSGDFNIDIPRSQLDDGDNLVEITARDGLGQSASRTVQIDYQSDNVPGLPWTATWAQASNVHDLGLPVDGDWRLGANAVGIDSTALGYERILAVGDQEWTDYEISTTAELLSLNNRPSSLSLPQGFGIYLRWNGHTTRRGVASQPLDGLEAEVEGEPTFGALGAVRIVANPDGGNAEFDVRNHLGQQLGRASLNVEFGVTYRLSGRVESLPDSRTSYSFWMWNAAEPEPAEPLVRVLVDESDLTPSSGSVAILANEAAVRVGDISVTPAG